MLGNIRTAAKRLGLVGGAIAVTASFAVAPMASASAKTCSSANGYKVTGANASLICAGIKAYTGQTLTFVAPDNVGGGFDQNARIYAPYLAKYLGATINIINVPAGNTVAGMNYVAGTNTTATVGNTMGWINVGPIVEDAVLGITGVQFNGAGEDFLGATAPNLTATVAFKSAACSTWDNGFAGVLANNSATNVVTEPIQTTGSTTFSELLLNGVFGIHYHSIPGYSSSTSLLAGWVRGDGCVVTTPVSTAAPYLVAGTAVPLIINVPLQTTNQYYKYLIGVPTYLQAEKTYAKYIKTAYAKQAVKVLNLSGETQRIFFVPPKTPHAEVAALTAAFKWAAYNPNLMGQLEAIGSPTGYTSPKAAKTGYIAYLAGTPKVENYLTQALG